MKDKIQHMIEMQDEFNKHVHPQWQAQHYPWTLAIIDECAEALNHYGWKWWAKKKEPNIPMVKLEMVDIWCFLLSSFMQDGENGLVEEMEKVWLDEDLYPPEGYTQDPFCGELKWFLNYITEYICEESATCLFRNVINSIGMDFDELYALFVGKMALNKLRQKKGYKEGKYQKRWLMASDEFVEDNVVLLDVCWGQKNAGDICFDSMYEELECLYEGCESIRKHYGGDSV